MDYNNIFYNYVYLDPRKPGDYNYGDLHFDFEPFYVGKGQYERCLAHLNETEETAYNFKKFNKINKIKRQGLEPIILKIYKNLEEVISLENEVYLIRIIGRHDKGLGPLTNLTDGGDGLSGMIFSDEHKFKLSIAKIGKKTGPASEERKRKISESRFGEKHWMYGKTLSESHIKKIIDSTTGNKNHFYNKKHSEKSIKKISDSRIGKYLGIDNPNITIYTIQTPTGDMIQAIGRKDVKIIIGNLNIFNIKNREYLGFKIIKTEKIKNDTPT